MKHIVTLRDNDPEKTVHQIVVHYTVGPTVNIDRFECASWESDIGAGVLRLIDGRDKDGPVVSIQYQRPWRILIR